MSPEKVKKCVYDAIDIITANFARNVQLCKLYSANNTNQYVISHSTVVANHSATAELF